MNKLEIIKTKKPTKEPILAKAKQDIVDTLAQAIGNIVALKTQDIKRAPDLKLGDLAYPCFVLAKNFKKHPAEVAERLAQLINKQLNAIKRRSLVEKVEASGPYLNFKLNRARFSQLIFQRILSQKEKYGHTTLNPEQKVMIEYSQPNTHKEFHIGHLRNVCLGSAVVKILKARGYKVISATYINDFGAHVAKCLWGYLKFHAQEKLPENKGRYLGKIYVATTQKIKENPEYKQEIAQLQKKLETGEHATKTLWKKTRQWSLEQFEKIYEQLGVKFEVSFYESDFAKEGKKIVRDLLKKNIAVESEGAVIVDLKKYDLEVLMLLKSDGTSLYATSDIPLAQEKFKKYKLDKSIYVVDVRQSLYFKQLFKVLELIGFTQEMYHLAYDFVTLPQGMISSRLGQVVLYEDFWEDILTKAHAETKIRHPDWKEKKLTKTARLIALGATKFDMLKQTPRLKICFDSEKALSFNGMTGPYLLYTYARISSIFKKSKTKVTEKINYNKLSESAEYSLVIKLAEFPRILKKASLTYDPSLIAQYLYELAKEFSNFYRDHSVLKAENEATTAARLLLLRNIQLVLKNGLNLLIIETLEEM